MSDPRIKAIIEAIEDIPASGGYVMELYRTTLRQQLSPELIEQIAKVALKAVDSAPARQREAGMGDAMRCHVLERTSPQGQSFVGVCVLCGKPALSFKQANEYCENVRRLSVDEALVEAIAAAEEDGDGK